MAEAGSWPSIRDYGLMSTHSLLARYNTELNLRNAILGERRRKSITISNDGMPNAIIRDQIPMSDIGLKKCLEDGLTPSDWYKILNQRTFFWVSQKRLRNLLGARAYRNKLQTVLTLRTSTLVSAHLSQIELSPINSGSTIYKPAKRGKFTFQNIADYDYEFWRKKRGAANAVVELVVLDRVADIRDHVLTVHDIQGDLVREIWRRKGTDKSIGP